MNEKPRLFYFSKNSVLSWVQLSCHYLTCDVIVEACLSWISSLRCILPVRKYGGNRTYFLGQDTRPNIQNAFNVTF